ncbi:hypothetical protein OF83DRAFT_1171658 [Amylostereum chailletii]|nr:hypothetical protein OF83DRAFT_1171658 [Amylostereum chailletii]
MRRGFLLDSNRRDPKPSPAAGLGSTPPKRDTVSVARLAPISNDAARSPLPLPVAPVSTNDSPERSKSSSTTKIRIPSGFFAAPERTPSLPEMESHLFSLKPQPRLQMLHVPQVPSQPDDVQTLCILWEDTRAALRSKHNFPAPFDPSINVGRFSIVDIAGKGKSMVAARDFELGELVVAERPLLVLPETMVYQPPYRSAGDVIAALIEHTMPPHVKRLYFDLRNSHPNTPGMSAAEGISNTNGLTLGLFPGWPGPYDAVFYYVSRANHSCSPNVRSSWELDAFTYELRAQRPIRVGEEITINYTNVYFPYEERQQDHISHWCFTCTCRACSLPPRERSQSDARRRILHDLMPDASHEREILTWIKNPKLPDDHILKKYLTYVNYMKEEDLNEADDWAAVLPPLVKTYCALGDAENAKRWATQAAGIEKAQTRKEGVWTDIAKSPERTAWWGLRRKSPKV